MSNRRNTRLAGHGLYAEGKACIPDPRYAYQMTGEKTGRGLCSCGAQSPALSTDAARRAWHQEHKDELRQQIQENGPDVLAGVRHELASVYNDEGAEIWLNARQDALGGMTALEAALAGKASLVFSLIERLAGGPLD